MPRDPGKGVFRAGIQTGRHGVFAVLPLAQQSGKTAFRHDVEGRAALGFKLGRASAGHVVIQHRFLPAGGIGRQFRRNIRLIENYHSPPSTRK